MIREAIILAGGLGTRLQGTVPDLPKPMAPVGGKPFLEFLFHYLSRFGIRRVVLSVGYRKEMIRDFFGKHWNGIEITYAEEKEPLGTGGGIKLAAGKCLSENYFILNGDSFFDVNLEEFYNLHKTFESPLSLALKPMENFDRYGTVTLDNHSQITGFTEKKPCASGLINGGIYIMEHFLWDQLELPGKFSFEKDLLETNYPLFSFRGFPFTGKFIDIGIPDDYIRAEEFLKDPQ